MPPAPSEAGSGQALCCCIWDEKWQPGLSTGISFPSLPDHRFFQKWAVISDPTDTRAGVKGFVKCNISVTARGDVVSSLPTSSSSQDEDIERWVQCSLAWSSFASLFPVSMGKDPGKEACGGAGPKPPARQGISQRCLS